jgi:putative membrane protein insertion efficiency factor
MDPTPQTRALGPGISLPARVLVALIRAYRFLLSPWIGQHCRFHPTCSLYGHEALIHHGALRGSALTIRRLARCHPWAEGGYDPVPPRHPVTRTTETPD